MKASDMGPRPLHHHKMVDSPNTTKFKLHPRFNNPAADTVLSSKDNTLYRVPGCTLRLASAFLRSILSDATSTQEGLTPTPINPTTIDVAKIVNLPFADGPLEQVLFMMIFQEVPPFSSTQELEGVVDVIEYLDARGLLSLIHALCFFPGYRSVPIKLYSIAARFGWEDAMQYAAEHSLHLNLLPPDAAEAEEIQNQLSTLDGRSCHRLLMLHRRRRDQFRSFLNSNLSTKENSLCPYCGWCAPLNVDSLINHLVWEIEQNSTGDTILSSPSTCGMVYRCTNCNREVGNHKNVMDLAKRGIDGLPKNLDYASA